MKKILITLLIALALIALALVDFGQIIDRFSPKEEKTCTLIESGKSVCIGMDAQELTQAFGTAKDTFVSEYGFDWNIYHNNFQNYIQIGTQDGVVTGIYTNSAEFSFEGFCVGSAREEIEEKYGEPLDGIVKGNTRYLSNGTDNGANFSIYKLGGAYVTFFYDTYSNNSLTSVNIIDCDVEQAFDMLYASPAQNLAESFEKQSIYVANALRVREGMKPFADHEELGELAFAHSSDMVENGYFSHNSQNGDTVLERAKKQNIRFSAIGENLAMGAQNSLYMHELLMNSEGHRANLLSDFTHMGTGVAFGDDGTPYLTQNFLK
ncbi:MAG: copper amine oxidase [Clostridia bacterium]|nr:copper amine oxidase [Clostridia bacterium]